MKKALKKFLSRVRKHYYEYGEGALDLELKEANKYKQRKRKMNEF